MEQFNSPTLETYVTECDKFEAWIKDNSDDKGAIKSADLLVEFHNRDKEINKLWDKVAEEKAVWSASQRNLEAIKMREGRVLRPGVGATGEGDEGDNSVGFGGSTKAGGATKSFDYRGIGDYLEKQMQAACKSLQIDGLGDTPAGRPVRFDLGAYTDPMDEMYDAAMKTVMTSDAGSAGMPVFKPRIPRIELYPTRRVVLPDVIPNIPTDNATFEYLLETVFTNNAAAVSENALKPTSTLKYAPQTVALQTIAHLMQFTKQQMDDLPMFSRTIEQRGLHMLDLVVETEMLTGSGTPPHLVGVNNVSGLNTQARGTDSIPDALYKLYTKIRTVGFAEPDLNIFHPNDWQDVRLLKTADGVYVWGSPAEAGPERIWGKPIVQTTAQTENTVLAGEFATYSTFFTKGGVSVEVRDTHDTDFAYNRLTTRIERRCAMVIYRPTAFGQVTGA